MNSVYFEIKTRPLGRVRTDCFRGSALTHIPNAHVVHEDLHGSIYRAITLPICLDLSPKDQGQA